MNNTNINPTTAKSNGLDVADINEAITVMLNSEDRFRQSFQSFIQEEIFGHFKFDYEEDKKLSLDLPTATFKPDTFNSETSCNSAYEMDEFGLSIDNIGYVKFKQLSTSDLMYFIWFIKDEWNEIVKANS